MELRHLTYFIAVAEERHFTRAAQRVHVAQSGLSTAIRSLERELGAELFIRNTRSVELTDAGRALLAEARHTVGAAEAARDAVAAVQGVVTGRLAIGTLQCLGGLNVSALLTRFHRAHPGVEIRLRQSGSTELLGLVHGGDLDAAFVSVPFVEQPGITLRPLSAEPLLLACAPDHPLAAERQIGVLDLKDETFVDFHPGWITRDLTDRVLAAACIERRVALEANDVHFLLDLVAGGLGVAVVPDSFRHKRTTAKFVPLADEVPHWELAVATPTGRRLSAAARAFLSDPALTP
ncbi:LysR family transcriptional regulator [Microlunatus parietis]|uniref:DNA-binding transcriptional LysR family regulator n=1 Tax=Microlunatus parietis TaxID=682979 RepID=A0A7Y9I9A7_9ACTN|nr:LysR family transcriptional regulator [Microlunatus parietis]NYE72699.1 DNA-binding transcriptional LysR family regulator [Microlunatus parietis]